MQQKIYLLIFLVTFCNSLRYRKSLYYFSLEESFWVTQSLDHFDNANKETWSQRYFQNDIFYEPGGPVFVMIEGESRASVNWFGDEPWLTWAREFNAQCYVLEHRYYGFSQPTYDLSVENLQYLSTEQALADIANFQQEMIAANPNLGGSTKWVYFGGSYAGALVAWFRLKYPHLAYAGVASSATVLVDVDSAEYLRIVYEAINNESPKCSQAIAKAMSQIQSYMDYESSDMEYLSEILNLCYPLSGNESKEVSNLYYKIIVILSKSVQYNSPQNDKSIKAVCEIMEDYMLGSELKRLAEVFNTILTGCFRNSYEAEIQILQQTYYNSLKSTRQWTYQMCTELGGFPTTSKATQLFRSTIAMKFYTDRCADIFGLKFDEKLLSFGVAQSNINYGGLNISLTRVIFSNGSLDPWHYLGILNDINDQTKAVFINGTSHCADMMPVSYNDPPQLVQAREIIRQEIKSWIYE